MDIIATHIAKEQNKPLRLQEYGVSIFNLISTKSALKKALKKELILVDGVTGSTATFINGGERIELKQVVEKKITRQVRLDVQVLYEDDHLAIIQKPAGITVSGNRFFTLANALAQNLKKSTAFDAVSPKPIHRLDYPTTGALLVGKTSLAIIHLNTLFEKKQIQKVYYAVAIGVMKKNGRVVVPIDGKESMSDYEVEQTIVSERFGYLNLVKLLPKTGRRHQLRKHLALIGNPILGDVDYIKEGLVLKGKGLYLHAYSLQFMHPIIKTNVCVHSELPKKFLTLFPTV
jgi:23S rRNA pseudouridine1911/1915/1917 synthase